MPAYAGMIRELSQEKKGEETRGGSSLFSFSEKPDFSKKSGFLNKRKPVFACLRVSFQWGTGITCFYIFSQYSSGISMHIFSPPMAPQNSAS